MKFKTMMIIEAIVCLTFSIPYLFFPKFLYSIFGVDLSGPGVTFPAHSYGASLVGNMLLAWLGRNAEKSIGRNAITWALFIYDAVGFIMALILAISGTISPLFWGVVVLYLLITLGFGYFLIKKPSDS